MNVMNKLEKFEYKLDIMHEQINSIYESIESFLFSKEKIK